MATDFTLLRIFSDGGWMMYPILLSSLVGLGVILAKGWTLWQAHAGSRRLLATVREAAREGRLDEALDLASRGRGPTATILTAGLRRIRSGNLAEGELEQAVATTTAIEVSFLERGLVVLATVAHVAPLMGFLGTVAGMIIAFGAIQVAGDVDPALVAGGIKVALLTTAAGLLIAIPVNVAHNFFVTRIDQLIVDMDEGAQTVLGLAWDLDRKGTIKIRRRPKKKGVRC
jgi:biopolymer transport protein ExbB